MPRLDVLIVGHNYAPEPVGIGPCTAGMAEMLAEQGHAVRVVCGVPYYPQWTVTEGYRRCYATQAIENGVTVLRLPHFVPALPYGWRRLLHHLSFALLALVAMVIEMRRRRADVIVAIAPSIISTAAARLVASMFGRPLWVHVQDLEAEMALATGQLRRLPFAQPLARALERVALAGERVSSIAPALCRRLVAKGVPDDRIVAFRNWARPDIAPLRGASPYRAEWRIDRQMIALYSGNIAAKQGIEIIIEAARLLDDREDLLFVICGEGPNRHRLVAAAGACPNLLFHDLQPADRLGDLLGLATVHLLPQIASAADLVLPSKLPNMLASGRPVIATAAPGTGLAEEVDGCGVITPPHDAEAFAAAIRRLIDDPAACAALGAAAEARAATCWSKEAILRDFERELRLLVLEWRAQEPALDVAAGLPAVEPLAE